MKQACSLRNVYIHNHPMKTAENKHSPKHHTVQNAYQTFIYLFIFLEVCYCVLIIDGVQPLLYKCTLSWRPSDPADSPQVARRVACFKEHKTDGRWAKKERRKGKNMLA